VRGAAGSPRPKQHTQQETGAVGPAEDAASPIHFPKDDVLRAWCRERGVRARSAPPERGRSPPIATGAPRPSRKRTDDGHDVRQHVALGHPIQPSLKQSTGTPISPPPPPPQPPEPPGPAEAGGDGSAAPVRAAPGCPRGAQRGSPLPERVPCWQGRGGSGQLSAEKGNRL